MHVAVASIANQQFSGGKADWAEIARIVHGFSCEWGNENDADQKKRNVRCLYKRFSSSAGSCRGSGAEKIFHSADKFLPPPKTMASVASAASRARPRATQSGTDAPRADAHVPKADKKRNAMSELRLAPAYLKRYAM